MPKVSVIIPAYNKAEFTSRAVDSVLGQSYKNIEVIVVDDGSTDDTRARMAAFGDRIRYIYKENGGACSARNVGISHAEGEFIGFLDCDDLYLPEKIEASVRFLEAHPDYGLVHTDIFCIDDDEHTVQRVRNLRGFLFQGWVKNELILYNYIFNPTVVVRRSCLEQSGLFDENLFPPADWDLWLRMAEHTKIGYISRPLSKYRISSNGCYNNFERMKNEYALVLERFFERNPKTSRRTRDRAYAFYHFSLAQFYIIKGDFAGAKDAYHQAIHRNPWNAKIFAQFVFFLTAKEALRHKKLSSIALK